MNIYEAISFGKKYLGKDWTGEVQCDFYVAYGRFEKEFGEVTKRDVALLFEAFK